MSKRVRYASSIVLTRGHGPALEVYLVERAPQLRFFGGYWAFPGGGIDASDKDDDGAPDETAFLRCALRELFEETGVMHECLKRGKDQAELAALRAELLEGRGLDQFRKLLDAIPESLSLATPLCRITTPEFIPIRFATDFLCIDLPEGQTPVVEIGELVQGRFVRPEEAVEEWKRGKLMIAPPVIYLLELLAGAGDFDAFRAIALEQTERIDRGALHELRFSPGITTCPLKTPTLPPATTTNCFLVGLERMYVVDPASYDVTEQQRLFDKMDEYIDAGRRFEAILLTHHHSDHIGAVNAVSSRYGIPVHAHKLTLDRIPEGFMRGRELNDGDRIELGTSLDGGNDWHLLCLHTPGHDRGHLCFLESRYQAAIVGDMLSTVSTIIIDPPEGHLRTYLDSLDRLLAYSLKALHPAHGPARQDGQGLVREYLQHRHDREAALVETLTNAPGTCEELVPKVYTDVPEQVFPYAARSLQAGLEKLQEERRAESNNGHWRLLS